jgi:hypothetical protein
VENASDMKKDELVRALAGATNGGAGVGAWVRDRSLGLFLSSWIAQLVVQWFAFKNEERIEQTIDRLLEEQGIDPAEVERQLPPKHRPRS